MPAAQEDVCRGERSGLGDHLFLFVDHKGRTGGGLERELIETLLRNPQGALPYQSAGFLSSMHEVEHAVANLFLGMLFAPCGTQFSQVLEIFPESPNHQVANRSPGLGPINFSAAPLLVLDRPLFSG